MLNPFYSNYYANSLTLNTVKSKIFYYAFETPYLLLLKISTYMSIVVDFLQQLPVAVLLLIVQKLFVIMVTPFTKISPFIRFIQCLSQEIMKLIFVFKRLRHVTDYKTERNVYRITAWSGAAKTTLLYWSEPKDVC